jgi:hypothetical protein
VLAILTFVDHSLSLIISFLDHQPLLVVATTNTCSLNSASSLPSLVYLRLAIRPRTISQSQVKESILSKMRIHTSLTNDDDIENRIITYVNDKWKEGSGGHMNDLFSQSIMNSNFNSPQKVGSVWARSSLKQLWEECCAEADEIGPEDVKELEDRLLSF